MANQIKAIPFHRAGELCLYSNLYLVLHILHFILKLLTSYPDLAPSSLPALDTSTSSYLASHSCAESKLKIFRVRNNHHIREFNIDTGN